MRFTAREFAPLLIHTALEPGDSVSLPAEVINDCVRMGFGGCAIIGGSRLLAAQQAWRSTAHLGLGGNPEFKVALGIELNVTVRRARLDCVLLARNQTGWRYLRNICTRSQGATGWVCIDLADLTKVGEDLVLLIRPHEDSLLRSVLKACKQVIPMTYLALGRPDADLEHLGMTASVMPVAAPDIHCMRLDQVELLDHWRDLQGLQPLDLTRCMTLTSIHAVTQRFEFRRKLLGRTKEILDHIEAYDLGSDDEPDASMAGVLAKYAKRVLMTQDIPAGRTEDYHDRLVSELDAIEAAGMTLQMLQASNLAGLARSIKVPAACGQGNLSCSLVAWALRITKIDPIAEDLPFQRLLRCDTNQTPTITLTFGGGAQSVVEDYLKSQFWIACRAYQTTTLGPDACAGLVSASLGLETEEQQSLLANLHQPEERSPQDPKPRRSPPIPYRAKRAIAVTRLLATLPWGEVVHPTRLLINTWRRPRILDPVAPILWEGASGAGFHPIDIVIDTDLDALDVLRQRLDPIQRMEVDSDKETRKHKQALKRAIQKWMQESAPIPSERLEEWLSQGTLRPRTFGDLVALHAFAQAPAATIQEVADYFQRDRDDRRYYFARHPMLKAIMAGTRGQILYDEQVENLMTRCMRIPVEQAENYLKPFRRDASDNRVERWKDDVDQIARQAKRLVNVPPLPGVVMGIERLRSSERKKMYRRISSGMDPSMSDSLARALHESIAMVLGQTRSKTLALDAASRAYERALLELANSSP